MFESLDKLIKAYFSGEFEPRKYEFVVRGGELFIYDNTTKQQVFLRYCGEIVMEVCAVFDVVNPIEI